MGSGCALGRSVTIAVFTALVCILPAPPALARAAAAVHQQPAKDAATAQATPPKPAEPKADTKAAKPEAADAAKNKDTAQPGGSNAPAGGGQAKAASPTWADTFAKVTEAIQKLLAAVLTSITVPAAALIIVVLLRKQIIRLLEEIVQAMKERSVSLDVGTFVKVQVAERAPEAMDELRPVYSPSPFEMDDARPREGSMLLSQVLPQQDLQMSDYVAIQWAEQPAHKAAADRMRSACKAFAAACARDPRDFDNVRPHLVAYARALEAVRFLEARELARLLREHETILDGVKKLRPTDVAGQIDEFLILTVAGVAFAHISDSTTASELLGVAAWKEDKALFIPAASMWIVPHYQSYLSALAGPKRDAPFEDALGDIKEIISRGETLVEAVEGQKWTDLEHVTSPKGYYVREAHKDVGVVASVVADWVSTRETRRVYLTKARPHLEKCARDLDGEPPSPLDHNNVADLYRQLGDLAQKIDGDEKTAADYYARAHAEMKEVFASQFPSGRLYDPAFYHTLALLLFSEGRVPEARRALDSYTCGDARRDDPLNLEQYFDNQVLAAKLAMVDIGQDGDGRGLATAETILEAAVRFLDEMRGTLEGLKGKAGHIDAQLNELLAFTYLQSARGEDRAVAAFDRLMNLWNPGGTPDSAAPQPAPWAGLRARTGRATALGQAARVQRRRLSCIEAARLTEKAATDIVEVLDKIKTFVPLDTSVPDNRRRRNAGVWLDAVRATQLLAEEQFAGSESKLAAETAKQVTDLARDLRLAHRALGEPANGEAATALRRVVARRALLGARLLVHDDPNLEKAETLTNLRAAVADVYGVSAHYDCQADLEMASALLMSARLRKGDPQKDYTAALLAFEHAVDRDAPSLRGDAVRALAQAHALRATVMRRPPKDSTHN